MVPYFSNMHRQKLHTILLKLLFLTIVSLVFFLKFPKYECQQFQKHEQVYIYQTSGIWGHVYNILQCPRVTSKLLRASDKVDSCLEGTIIVLPLWRYYDVAPLVMLVKTHPWYYSKKKHLDVDIAHKQWRLLFFYIWSSQPQPAPLIFSVFILKSKKTPIFKKQGCMQKHRFNPGAHSYPVGILAKGKVLTS